MFKTTILILCVSAIMLGGFMPASAATGDDAFEYLSGVYERFDKKLGDYLIAELENWLAIWPDNDNAPRGHFILAKVYEDRGARHQALATYARGIFLHPASEQRSHCREGVKRLASRIKTYKERVPELEAMLETAAPGKPADRFFGYLEFLSHLDATKLHARTQSESTRFVIRFPGDRRGDIVNLWAALSWSNRNKHRETVLALEKLEAVYPTSLQLPCSRFSRADILYRELGDAAAARPLLDNVIANYPSSSYAPRAMALRAEISLKGDKNYNAAIEDLRRLIDGWPTAPGVYEARLSIADIYEKKLKDYDKAAAECGRIAALDPTAEEGIELLMRAGRLHESKTRNYALAISYYQEIVARYPDHMTIPNVKKKISKLRDKVAEQD
ncbi:MAG: tetratricopeptide repeat protein [bacterium]|nr:tetratricopeptide repeat protein [bacterium]